MNATNAPGTVALLINRPPDLGQAQEHTCRAGPVLNDSRLLLRPKAAACFPLAHMSTIALERLQAARLCRSRPPQSVV